MPFVDDLELSKSIKSGSFVDDLGLVKKPEKKPSFISRAKEDIKTGYNILKENPEAGYEIALKPLSEILGLGEKEPLITSGADTLEGYGRNVIRGLRNTGRSVINALAVGPQFALGLTKNLVEEPLKALVTGKTPSEYSTLKGQPLVKEAKGLVDMIVSGIPVLDRQWAENLFMNPDTVAFGKMLAKDVAKGTVNNIGDVIDRAEAWKGSKIEKPTYTIEAEKISKVQSPVEKKLMKDFPPEKQVEQVVKDRTVNPLIVAENHLKKGKFEDAIKVAEEAKEKGTMLQEADGPITEKMVTEAKAKADAIIENAKKGLEAPEPEKIEKTIEAGEDIIFSPSNLYAGIPITPGAVKKVIQPLRDFDPSTALYKKTTKRVEDWRKARNYAALKSIKARETINKILPNLSDKEAITYALDEPVLAENLTANQRQVYNGAKQMYDSYRIILSDEGILNQFQDNYVNRIIKETPQRGRVPSKGMGGQLGSKPAFTRRRVRTEEGETYTIRELEDMGYVVEKDISKLTALYQFTAEEAIANKRLVDFLKQVKTRDGNKALLPFKDIPFDKRRDYYLVDEMQLKRWSGRKISDEATQLFQIPTALHKDAWHLVDNILRDRKPPSTAYKLYAHLRGGVKRFIMFNPLIHGFNIESNVIMSLGHDYPKRFRMRTPEEIDALRERMVRNGVELEGLFDVKKRLLYDIYELKVPEHKTISSMVKHPFKTIRDLGDKILWDRWVKSGQMIIYDVLEQRFLNKGLNEAQAGKSAAMMTNDLMGTLPSTWFTKRQRKALFALMFARNWTVSNLRTISGMLGKRAKSELLPKPLRFEDVSDVELKAMSKQYKMVILKGVIGLLATSNAIQYMFLKANGQPYHPTWQNERDHFIDIDTGMVDSKGRKIYLKNWLFRQIDDYIKLAEGHPIQFAKAKAEPIMRTVAEIVLNVDYLGKPIVPKGADRSRALKEISKYIVKGITPLDNFFGREDDVRSWAEAILPLTGTWIRHGMPIGTEDARFGDILRGYYEYEQKKSLLNNDMRIKARKLIQQGKDEEAFKLIDGIELKSSDIRQIERSLKAPFWSRVTQRLPNGSVKLRSDFAEYLVLLPKEKQEMFKRALKGETENITSINIPSETQSKKEYIENQLAPIPE